MQCGLRAMRHSGSRYWRDGCFGSSCGLIRGPGSQCVGFGLDLRPSSSRVSGSHRSFDLRHYGIAALDGDGVQVLRYGWPSNGGCLGLRIRCRSRVVWMLRDGRRLRIRTLRRLGWLGGKQRGDSCAWCGRLGVSWTRSGSRCRIRARWDGGFGHWARSLFGCFECGVGIFGARLCSCSFGAVVLGQLVRFVPRWGCSLVASWHRLGFGRIVRFGRRVRVRRQHLAGWYGTSGREFGAWRRCWLGAAR